MNFNKREIPKYTTVTVLTHITDNFYHKQDLSL